MRKILILSLLSLLAWHVKAQDFKADTTKGCVPALINFNALIGDTWEWDFGDGSTPVFTNPASHAYMSAGVYTVKCTINFANGNPQQIITKTNYITVSAGPNVDFTADFTSVCPGESISFTSSVSPGGNAVQSYLWDFGDGYNSTLENPSHTYFTSATRTVSLRVIDTIGCSKRAEKQNYITIKPEPVASYRTSDSVFCVEDNTMSRQVTFYDQSSSDVVSYLWDFGDGSTSTQQNPPTKTYPVGFYNVSLIVTNNHGCKDTLKRIDQVIVAVFEASFKASDTVVCGLGKTVTFTGTGYGANFYKWDFGDGREGVGTMGVQNSYTNPGKYTIRTIATSRLGCSDTMTKVDAIWVFDTDSAIVEIHDTDHCNPNAPIIFINRTQTDPADDLGLSNASWDFGDGSANIQGDSVSHVYGYYGSFETRAWITTGYGCVLPVKKQVIDIYKIYATAVQVVPNVLMGEKPGGCFPHFVAMAIDTLITSSPVIDYIWDWGETEVWGSAAAPDTTHTDTVPFGTYTYEYDTGVYIVNLILTNKQGCHDTVVAFATVPVGYPPINDWYFTNNKLCKSELSITVYAYDSLNPVDSSLVARSRANLWEWYDPMGNPMSFTNPGNLSPIDTGWLHGYSLLPYHNHCPGKKVAKDSIMYSCPPMTGINYPAPSMKGNPPVYCEWPVFGFDGGDGQKTKAWDSCVWRLGNFYTDSYGVYHPQTLILPNAAFPQGQIAPADLYRYDTLGGIEMVVERGGHIFVTIWAMNDNRNGNNLCGYCEDSSKQEIIISIADMRLRATDEYGNIVTEVCEDDKVYLYDSTFSTDGIYWWALSMLHNNDKGQQFFSTEDLMSRMQADFLHPNEQKPIWDATNYVGSQPFIFEFDDWGIYKIFLKDTSAEGCGLNSSPDPPYIEWQTAHWGPYKPYEGRTDTIQIIVNPRSVPKFSSNSPVCLGDTLELIDESYTAPPFSYYNIDAYLWHPSGQATDTAKNAKFVFTNTGRYDLTLTVTNEKGCDSTEKFPFAITVMGVTTAFTTPQLPPNDRKVCNKEIVNFTNTSTYFDMVSNTTKRIDHTTSGMTYLWDFDGQGTSNSRNGQFAFNVSHSRYVYIRLTITDAAGCTNSFLDSIWVIRPVAEFTSGTHEVACPELDVHFANLSHGMDTTKTAYQWEFGDTLSLGNNTSVVKNPIHNYAYAGKFDVKLVVIDEFGCTDTMIKPEYVQVGGPYGTFAIDTTSGCVPLRVEFTFDIKSVEFKETYKDSLILFYGDGTSHVTDFIGAPIIHNYTQAGYYIPLMQLIKWVYNSSTGKQERCVRSFISKDTIWVIKIKPDFAIEPLYCKDVPITFTNLTDTNNNNIVPTMLGLDTLIWEYGNNLTDTLFNITDSIDIDGHTQYDSAGSYKVYLDAKIKTCRVRGNKTIKVMEFPNIIVVPDSVGECVGLDVILTADSLNGHETDFAWTYTSIGDTSSGNPVTRYFNEPGTNKYPIEIMVTFSPKDCYKKYYDTLTVSAWTPPTAEFKIENSEGGILTDAVQGINAGADATFTDQSIQGDGTLTKWLWLFGDGDVDSSGAKVTHAYTTKSGFITVTMGVSDEYGCSDTTTHQILILESLKFPNVFTPNGDGKNDKFEPWEGSQSGFFLSFEMEIYNKWGAMVWKRKCEAPNCPDYQNENFWWDGKNKQGKDVPDGVYYWVVYAKPESEKGDIILNGSITLVR
ncbi:MAG: PKD domain-containing protein [Bacteroidales bacterium]|nr:PKD domain-containing protein [Bacteroidales bacterium]